MSMRQSLIGEEGIGFVDLDVRFLCYLSMLVGQINFDRLKLGQINFDRLKLTKMGQVLTC